MNELALFAGAGGGILAGTLLGWRTVCAVEREPYAASVLVQRQNDGILNPFPIWDDVRTFDGKPWRGIVDVVSGGFPCQDVSVAGKGAGLEGERSGLWEEMRRIIGEVVPRYVFVENSPALTFRGLGRVLRDLAGMGYDARWGVLGAVDTGAPHRRKRIWILAHLSDTDQDGCNLEYKGQSRSLQQALCPVVSLGNIGGVDNGKPLGDAKQVAINGVVEQGRSKAHGKAGRSLATVWWKTEPELGRVADELADTVDRLQALGNGQVPIVAATAWRILAGKDF